ncbi:glutamate receptor 3.7 [Salvia miltiorrhiza]|uniref:glutamate receptor 3.7 n=1 Tax=Salvia miltiorrhiza TaxID=226208 RepID=UPI0025AC482E|nr:glutamate receptor 3.7 [Salvia miltiorrhiza]
MEYLSVMAVAVSVLELVFLQSSVSCEKPAVVKVGAVFTFESVIGRGAKTAMEMAVEDVNSDPTILNGTHMELLMEDLGCSVFMGSIKAFKVIENEVVAIIGPQSSAIARIISHIATGLQIPVVSYAATDPSLSSLQFPFFVRTAPPDSTQMLAMADLVDLHGWKEVIAVFEDTDYGRNAVAALGDALATKMSRIAHKLPLSPLHNSTEVTDALLMSKSLGPRVYVVHISPDPSLRFFKIARDLGMISAEYVWLATDWLTSTLDSFPSGQAAFDLIQGVVTLRPRVATTGEMQGKGLTVYGVYAYDTVWLVALAVDRFLREGGGITFSSSVMIPQMQTVENFKVFDGGEALLQLLLSPASNFSGLQGRIRFDDSRSVAGTEYEVLNVVEDGCVKVGFWANHTGLSAQSPESVRTRGFEQSLGRVIWPGGVVQRPRGFVVATAERPLRVGFPNRISFSDFVSEHNDSSSHGAAAQGYCIDLFLEVLRLVPYDVPHRFVSFGNGLRNPSYDQLVRLVADDVLDAAVGDIAIVTDRIKIVDFTLPFAATGLAIVAPLGNSTSNGWVFIKPFSLELWCAAAVSFVVIAVVIWMLEHRVNDEFRGPPQRQLRTMFLFSFSTLFKANYETTVSTAAKLVMVVWLFLLLVITSSYTASLSSILTVQQLSTCITGLDSLVSSGLPIGYQVGSFAYSYMTNSLNIHPSRLVSLGSPEEYAAALRRGPGNGGVAAIVDETPYVDLFLSKQPDYGMAGQPFTKSGWGFAFQKNSPLAVDVSTAILKLTESGQLEKINKKWFCKSGCPGEQGKKPEPNELHLNSFLVLYALTGIAAAAAFSVFLVRAVRQYIDYKRRQVQRDPSSLAISSSSDFVFSRAIHNFLQFVDEKEEAIKRFFAQENAADPTEVSSR